VKVSEGEVLGRAEGGVKRNNLSGAFVVVGKNVVSLSYRIHNIHSAFLPIYLAKIST
jgi:hypothetical protein